MGLVKFIKDGGFFGKMRGFDSDKEGHWYGFNEFNEDIANCSTACEQTSSIPYKVKKSFVSGNSEKQKLITSNDGENKKIEN